MIKLKNLFHASMIFFGYILSANGISANSEKVYKVRNWPVQKNTKELHSLPGLVSFYCWFIVNFACMGKCLHQLIGPANVKKIKGKKKEVTALRLPEQGKYPFIWMSEHQVAFGTIKTVLMTAPVLGYLDFTKEFILETDASLKRCGCCIVPGK